MDNTLVSTIHGIAEIQGKENNGVFILKTLRDGFTLLLTKEYFRPLVSKDEYVKGLEVLTTTEKLQELKTDTWNRRYKKSLEILKENNFIKLCQLYGELIVLSELKDLSFGERKLKATLKERIEEECFYVQGI